MRYTSMGGIGSPRRWARASRSHRSLTRADVGRNRRSKSRVESTVPTIESSGMVCRPSRRSPRMPSAATTSSNGRIRLTSSGPRRSRWASLASTCRRRMRRKSFSTSARGKPVSRAIAVTGEKFAEGAAGLDLEQVPPGHVADHGAPQRAAVHAAPPFLAAAPYGCTWPCSRAAGCSPATRPCSALNPRCGGSSPSPDGRAAGRGSAARPPPGRPAAAATWPCGAAPRPAAPAAGRCTGWARRCSAGSRRARPAAARPRPPPGRRRSPRRPATAPAPACRPAASGPPGMTGTRTGRGRGCRARTPAGRPARSSASPGSRTAGRRRPGSGRPRAPRPGRPPARHRPRRTRRAPGPAPAAGLGGHRTPSCIQCAAVSRSSWRTSRPRCRSAASTR